MLGTISPSPRLPAGWVSQQRAGPLSGRKKLIEVALPLAAIDREAAGQSAACR